MIKVAIIPVPTTTGAMMYRATAGDKQSTGKTAGEALDALTTQLSEDESAALVILQSFRADQFFDAGQQQRLAQLMDRWRAARDAGTSLAAAEQAELDALVAEEVQASAARTAALLQELAR